MWVCGSVAVVPIVCLSLALIECGRLAAADSQHEERPRRVRRAVPAEPERRQLEGRDAARADARFHGREEVVLLRGAEHDGPRETYVERLWRAEV